MDNERRAYSVPETIREQFVAGDGFAQRLSQATGLRVFSFRPIYTDHLVIRQPWLRAPGGCLYTDRALYHLFAEHRFRTVLRLLLVRESLSKQEFLNACEPSERQEVYLAFLRDQDMLLQGKQGYSKGPALLHTHDLGHTLEAWVAEWLRRFSALRGIRLDNPPGPLPIRHGVSFTELVGEGDPGDLDVVALFPRGLILIECKSSLLQIDPAAWRHFAWRAAFLESVCALLLIDTPESMTSKAFRAVQRRLRNWQFTQATQNNENVCIFQRTGPLWATGPAGQALGWEDAVLYAALVGREQSLEDTLENVFQRITLYTE